MGGSQVIISGLLPEGANSASVLTDPVLTQQCPELILHVQCPKLIPHVQCPNVTVS